MTQTHTPTHPHPRRHPHPQVEDGDEVVAYTAPDKCHDYASSPSRSLLYFFLLFWGGALQLTGVTLPSLSTRLLRIAKKKKSYDDATRRSRSVVCIYI